MTHWGPFLVAAIFTIALAFLSACSGGNAPAPEPAEPMPPPAELEPAPAPEPAPPPAPNLSEVTLPPPAPKYSLFNLRQGLGSYDDIVFHRDGKLGAVAYHDAFAFYDVKSRRLLNQVFPGDFVGHMAFSPATNELAVELGFPDRTIAVFEVRSGKELRRFPIPTQRTKGFRISPDGTRILVANTKEVVVYDFQSGERVWGHEYRARLFSTDSLIDATPDWSLFLFRFHTFAWDGSPGSEPVVKKVPVGTVDFDAPLTRLTPDGRHLITAQKEALQMYDLETGALVKELPNPEFRGSSMDLSADGKSVAVHEGIWNLESNTFEPLNVGPKQVFIPDGSVVGAFASVDLSDTTRTPVYFDRGYEMRKSGIHGTVGEGDYADYDILLKVPTRGFPGNNQIGIQLEGGAFTALNRERALTEKVGSRGLEIEAADGSMSVKNGSVTYKGFGTRSIHDGWAYADILPNKNVVMASDDKLYLVEEPGGNVLATSEAETGLTATPRVHRPLTGSPDGRLAAIHTSKGVRILEIASGKEVMAQVPLPPRMALSFNPSGTLLVAYLNEDVRCWVEVDGTWVSRGEFKAARGLSPASVDAAHASADGQQLILTTSSTPNIFLYEWEDAWKLKGQLLATSEENVILFDAEGTYISSKKPRDDLFYP